MLLNRLLLMSFLILLPTWAMAEGIVIDKLKVTTKGQGLYHVNALVDYSLSQNIKKALSHGIKVRLNLDVTLGRYRSWWWNSTRPLSTLNYQIKYHALSKRYILVKMQGHNEVRHWNFSSLPLLLKAAGRVENYKLPKIGTSVSVNDGNHFLYFKVTARTENFRLPLRIQSYIKNDKYYQESEGVVWPLG